MELEFECPHCGGSSITQQEDRFGSRIVCRSCSEDVEVSEDPVVDGGIEDLMRQRPTTRG